MVVLFFSERLDFCERIAYIAVVLKACCVGPINLYESDAHNCKAILPIEYLSCCCPDYKAHFIGV